MTQSLNRHRPKISETVIHPTANLRDSSVGRCCEVLSETSLHNAELGDFSYLGPRCMVGDAMIGRFCAIAADVRIGAPNHPMDRPSLHRFTYCPEYYVPDAVRDHAFFDKRKADRVHANTNKFIGRSPELGLQLPSPECLLMPRPYSPFTITGPWRRRT